MRIKKSLMLLSLAALVVFPGCKSSGSASETSVPASTTPSPVESSKPTPTPASTPTSSSPPASQGTSASVAMKKVTAVRLADPKAGWIGGDGWLAHTDNAGVDWKVQYTGKGTIRQIFALNGQEAWAVQGDSNNVLATTDGGKSWSATGGHLPSSAFLHFVSKQEAFSGNAQTKDGGKTWTTLVVPEGISGDSYFHDAKNGWAARQKGSNIEVLRTQDGGQHWSTVMTKPTVASVTGTIIRSAGADDAWIAFIGESGMTQTSYSLFHTRDGGKNWQTVLVNSTAGGGPAPGFPTEANTGPKNAGSKPGPLYVASPDVAFMAGLCPACDKPVTVGSTTDGGKTWVNGKQSFTGYGDPLLAIADAKQGWLITNDNDQPSVMYTTSDGGVTWKSVHTFDAPK
ncbi:hypothetical protein [Paenibacillus whitsoniae]|uniref:Photosynthesis system II assembly factor Ycf48/Hcf136-like domain-containing protein n=1 Tax=Paenibacillus whitsoniae TaxID=2496558 RepID=A0A430J3Q0_9BACL|nr:hypothetical protein [Paenibacillus whitsoniae]RTD99626.1 hypothetical protein EJQ19_31640 [Paenibacillus whitsoniae]